MAKSAEELAASVGGQTLETNGMGSQERPHNRPGVYKHPKSGAEMIAKWHPLFGNAQADGIVRLGFEWDREVQAGDIKEVILEVPKSGAPAANGVTSDDLKGIQARLNELEKAGEEKDAKIAELEAEKAAAAAAKNDALADETSTKTPKKEDK